MTTASRSMNYPGSVDADSRARARDSKPRKKPKRPRSGALTPFDRYSRFAETSRYGKRRRKRIRKRNALVISLITVFLILAAAAAAVYYLLFSLDLALSKNIDIEAIDAVTVDRDKPGDPFWALLQGTDNYDPNEIARSDTLILARIDPARKTAALVSIPRDTYVYIPGFWHDKINSAYTWGSIYDGYTGPGLSIATVTALTGIEITYYAQIDISGFRNVVDALGGVRVDVAVDVYNDYDYNAPAYWSYYPAISKGEDQLLTGEYALLFCRSRYYGIGDYQRQANQRTFLQALARQTLAADPVTIANTVKMICDMTSTNITSTEIIALARSMRGMEETDIYTYSLPCYSDYDYEREISYEKPDMAKVKILMESLDAGIYPDPDELGLIRQGTTPDSYKPKTGNISDTLIGGPSIVETADFVVDSRNGCGIAGCATAISDYLVSAGYQRGEIGNTSAFMYRQTLIIFKNDSDRLAAEDIRIRLGFGRVITSLGRYDFNGNILIVVGDDFELRDFGKP